MANRKIKHITATLSGAASAETFDIMDESAHHREFILIGDSFGFGIDGDNNTSFVSGGGWIDRCKAFLEANGHTVHYTERHMAGLCGFTSSLTFQSMLQACIEDDVSEPELVTDIIVLGGTNDWSSDGDTITNAVIAFESYAHSVCPNALIKIGCIGSNPERLQNDVEPYYKNCIFHNCLYIQDLLSLFGAKPEYIGSDGVHLTEAGYKYYATWVAEAILTGHASYAIQGTSTFTVNSSAFSVSGDLKLSWTVIPEGIIWQLDGSSGSNTIYWNSGTAPSATGGDAELGTYSALPRRRNSYRKIASVDIVVYDSSTKVAYPYLFGVLYFNDTRGALRIAWYSGDFVMSSANRFKVYIPRHELVQIN